jgi:hypothetical protein
MPTDERRSALRSGALLAFLGRVLRTLREDIG